MHLKIERLFMHGTIFRHQWEWIKFGDEDLKKVLTRMILHLDACLMFLQKAMKNSEKEED